MVVIVVGMHRSGTSALAGTLHANGICMGEHGDFFPPPMKENPKGFYENRRFRTINDHLLRQQDYRVKSFDPKVPPWDAECGSIIYGQMDVVVDHYINKYTHWGWKDPRTCLTLRPWLDTVLGATQTVKVLLTVRKGKDVARSMRARGNKERKELQFEALTHSYYRSALLSLRDAKVAYHEVPFDRLIHDTAACLSAVSDYLDVPLPEIDFVDRRVSQSAKQASGYVGAGAGI